ncbi:hypothetical protein Nepgr_004325 [Nepenthes gracilis]|uniref:Uncharacterized protein n=1 Tax=Nepenthes gracilis TaxID=150966 RepID=A0AAD3S180_NEPGR|nr:hypothetical protein Nepgr_004325 [Nepenthes gracilis]
MPHWHYLFFPSTQHVIGIVIISRIRLQFVSSLFTFKYLWKNTYILSVQCYIHIGSMAFGCFPFELLNVVFVEFWSLPCKCLNKWKVIRMFHKVCARIGVFVCRTKQPEGRPVAQAGVQISCRDRRAN